MFVLSYVMSIAALILYSSSYFFNNKKTYLILQLTGNAFLSLSYLAIGAYFTMVSVAIGIVRGLICFYYEKKDKSVPIFAIVGLCSASILSYFLINFVLLSQAMVWDVVYLVASCMYAVTFSIRNIRLMRYVTLIPHSCAVAYNLLVQAPFSSAISYGIELAVTVVAIVKDELQRIHAARIGKAKKA